MTKHTLTGEGRSKTGMTLRELADFVDQAMRVGATGDEVPQVRPNFRSRVKTATVSIEHDSAATKTA